MAADWLREILVSVQLEQFYLKFKEDDISLPSHFDHVTPGYLTKKGLSGPAQKRLLDAVKKYKKKEKKYNKKHGPIVTSDNNSVFQSTSGGLIDESNVEEGRELGDGSFGVVRAGVWRNGNKRINVAIKTLKLGDEVDMSSLQDFILEISAMNKLNNQYLLPLYGVVLSNPLKIISQLAPEGNLLSKLRKRKLHSLIRLTEYAVQIAKGMDFLANEGFIHRDLACRNVLIFNESEVKIGDFGMMRRVGSDGVYTMQEKRKVPIAWSAPESLRKRQFSEKSDVWSFGVLLWEIFTFGDHPWKGSNAKEIITMIEQGVRMNQAHYCSSSVWDLVMSCWNMDVGERPTFSQIIAKMLELIPVETKVTRDSYENSQAFVRRGQSVYVIREMGEGKFLVQSTASLEVKSISVDCLDSANMIKGAHVKPTQNVRLVTKRKDDFISLPVENSFVHAAHGSSLVAESWGQPDSISSQILANPVVPHSNRPSNVPQRTPSVRMKPSRPAPAPKRPSQAVENPKTSNPPTEDLLGDLETELRNRPFVYREESSFAALHNKIGASFGIERTDSFDSFEGDQENYYEPTVRDEYMKNMIIHIEPI